MAWISLLSSCLLLLIPPTQCLKPSLNLRIDDAQPLMPPPGTPAHAFPPLVSVPCDIFGTADQKTTQTLEIIKPPNVDTLYEWYTTSGQPDADPSWADVWPTAVGVANYLLQHPELIANKRVVELGAGLGLVGLVADQCLGAQRVTWTDREPWALHCAMASGASNRKTNDNVGISASSCQVQATLLDWQNNVPPDLAGQADVIVATDVLYDVAAVPLLVKVMRQLAVKDATGVVDQTMVLLGDPQRERAAGAREALATALGAKSKVVTTDLPLPKTNTPAATTMDGRDYERRLMKENVVLLKFQL